MRKLFLAAILALFCQPLWAATDCNFIRGDANNDGAVDVSDGVYIGRYLFSGGPEPQPTMDAGDANDDGAINISDMIWIYGFLFNNGPAPPGPYPAECIEGSDDAIDFDECGTNYRLGQEHDLNIGATSFPHSLMTFDSWDPTDFGFGNAIISATKYHPCHTNGGDAEATYNAVFALTGNAPIKFGELVALAANGAPWQIEAQFWHYWSLALDNYCKECEYTGKNDNTYVWKGRYPVWLTFTVGGQSYEVQASANGVGNLFEGGAANSDPYGKCGVLLWQDWGWCDCEGTPPKIAVVSHKKNGWGDFLDTDDYKAYFGITDPPGYVCIDATPAFSYGTQNYTTQLVTWTASALLAAAGTSHNKTDNVVLTGIEIRDMRMEMDIFESNFVNNDYTNYTDNQMSHGIEMFHVAIDAHKCP